MEEHLIKAANRKYVHLYKKTGIPYFFIGTKKSYVPFVHNDLEYEDFSNIKMDYAAGYYYLSETVEKTWALPLNNYEENERNIKTIYTQIFELIADPF